MLYSAPRQTPHHPKPRRTPHCFLQLLQHEDSGPARNPRQDPTPQPCAPDPQFSGSPLSSFQAVTESEVAHIIKIMSFKTCELDPLPLPLYSDCLPHLLPFITDIINQSLQSGSVPDSY